MIGGTYRIMDIIRTGMEEYRYSYITSGCGTDSTRGGGIVAIKRGGGGTVIMAGDPGTPSHTETT